MQKGKVMSRSGACVQAPPKHILAVHPSGYPGSCVCEEIVCFPVLLGTLQAPLFPPPSSIYIFLMSEYQLPMCEKKPS